DLTDDEWDDMEAVNLRAVFQMTRDAATEMSTRETGSIVCVSSIAARGFRLASNAAYAAQKGALVSFARVAAMQLGPTGVRINCVCPGPTRTSAYDRTVAALAEREGRPEAEIDAGMVERFGTDLRRMVTAAEVASAIVFLLSDEASGITGQALN